MIEKNYRIRIKHGEIEVEFEGDKDFVEKHYNEYKKDLPKINDNVFLQKGEDKPLKELEQESYLGKISLVEFFKEKQPEDHYDKIVVFGYWLAKKEGKEIFSPKDIKECYQKVATPKPAHIPNFMTELASSKKAYLIRGDKKGKYSLSLTGKEYVENELPKKTKK